MKTFFKLVCIYGYLVTQTVFAQDIALNTGSGSFDISGSGIHENDSVTIFYHKPAGFTRNSKILIVVPGAGRNGASYRNPWIEASEKYNFLILSLSYPEAAYNYGDYHLGGVVKNLDISKGVTYKKGTNQVHIDEDVMQFNINPNKNHWIFNDFDRIFNLVKKTTKSKQKKYDMFGHSAGGQIAHRFVLLFPNSKADRILASNSGTYTLPDWKTKYPFGIKNLDLNNKDLKKSFKKKLVLFLGELDNDSETRGKMLRSETADKQGTNRIDRGKNFYAVCEKLSKQSGIRFNWNLEIIPGIGHNQKKMAKVAATYLYDLP